MKVRNRQYGHFDDVQKFYELGVRSLRDAPLRLAYGKAADDAENEGVHPEMLRKARQVAQEFSRKDFKTLVVNCRRSEYELGLSHLMRLASVRKGRRQLIDRMIRQRWSLRELNNEIARHAPSFSSRGRRRLIPLDQGGQLVVLKKECHRWQRLSRELLPKLRSQAVGKALQQTKASMDRLAAALDRR
ncbi:MAG: hypothetical protein J0M17_11140 [Planctomycetes bacterium]|nr:hypothetical protein [Planctomycetota bacterium]